MRNYRLWSVFSKRVFGSVSFLITSLISWPLFAVVNVEGTRVVLNSGETVYSLNLINSEKQPTLVQLWSDDGDVLTPPDKTSTPIVAVPPVFRMAPGEVKTVRLLVSSRQGLPADKEALFWLNIFQIPPNTGGEMGMERKVVLPLRIRMKVFVRPAGISKLQEEDGEQLKFKARKNGNRKSLSIINPTPWHITVSEIMLNGKMLESVMVAPKSEAVIPAPDAVKGAKVHYQIINDDGFRWGYVSKTE